MDVQQQATAGFQVTGIQIATDGVERTRLYADRVEKPPQSPPDRLVIVNDVHHSIWIAGVGGADRFILSQPLRPWLEGPLHRSSDLHITCIPFILGGIKSVGNWTKVQYDCWHRFQCEVPH